MEALCQNVLVQCNMPSWVKARGSVKLGIGTVQWWNLLLESWVGSARLLQLSNSQHTPGWLA